jgi:formyl-CoA transferase
MLKPPFNFDGMDVPMGRIPAVGEHTDAILAELGIDAPSIAEWRSKGII